MAPHDGDCDGGTKGFDEREYDGAAAGVAGAGGRGTGGAGSFGSGVDWETGEGGIGCGCPAWRAFPRRRRDLRSCRQIRLASLNSMVDRMSEGIRDGKTKEDGALAGDYGQRGIGVLENETHHVAHAYCHAFGGGRGHSGVN